MIAEEMGLELGALSFELEAELDTRGIFGKAEVTRPFPRVRLKVEAETAEGEDRIGSLRAELARRCPVAVILRQAGVELIEEWTAVRPRP
jgi:putative redox protein